MSEQEHIQPERIDVRHIRLKIVGDSPLITHAWSDKAKKMMLDKQQKRGAQAKEAKNPEQDYEDSLYRLSDGSCGFPAVGVKACAIRGAKSLGLVMTDARAAFHINGDLLKINGEPHPREDMVRIGMGTADIRYRGEFSDWSIDLPITYNARTVSAEQIVAMLDAGGFGTGLGEWRPEKDGQFGRFHVGADA
ncbi:MAG: hypothetical protein IT345_10650 [Trueperaceae bacterium]|nr:hypothetical protein [Trueperaceae bacterium]